MVEFSEERRGEPKLKPPFPAVAGLYACPTVINNVETLACLPHIVTRGVEWFRGIGPEQSPGPKLYCLSGHVQKPGVYELPMGISLRELVEDHAGGARPGRKFQVAYREIPAIDLNIAYIIDPRGVRIEFTEGYDEY
mgnify:CR=1 FL=1